MFRSINTVHFVGIGGIGMSGIAEILIDQGFKVSGSDLNITDVTERLTMQGAKIFSGHSAENIIDADVVVYSSAVKPEENVETAEALKRKIPTIRRAEMLAEVTRMKYGVAVAGTHGKTTTTSMIGLVMIEGGLDPTVIVGGKLSSLGGTNARLGHGEWTVVEADEFDRSFLTLSPTIAVVNNMEREHLDIYSDLDDIKSAFIEFANKVPFYGFVAICLDETSLLDIIPFIKKRVIGFGTTPQCDIRAVDMVFSERTAKFNVIYNGKNLGEVTIGVPGEHNVKNALAAITVGLETGVNIEDIAKSLKSFTGVYRRFEVKGEENGIIVIDDYAHHPTEVKATLEAIRKGWKDRRVIGVFQPHTFTRTRDFYEDFGKAFFNADLAIITDIYPARERPIQGITGELVSESASKFGHRNVEYVQDKNELANKILSIVKSGDIVITMGAGDIWKTADEVLKQLKIES
ncbi:MAG: UDP-N-acetylmuramate--L-alanine ligase [Chlorobiota bacterium]|nr:UDP-N-acetylmuramate--L-alanine ligase [Chlorobiota bacterium]QQS66702.1 MAG: UDP-N-acetylmuramate--L-alanine ligase [Chlorobiota bacterium]